VKIESVQHYGYVNMCSWEVAPNAYPRLVVHEHDGRTFEILTADWCHDATVKQHGPKKLIAFYCPTIYGPEFEQWRIIRRLGEGKYVEDCVSKGATPPDLDRVPPLAESAASMLKCTYALQGHGEGLSGNKYMAGRYRAIADALAKGDGARAVAKMLDQTLDVPPLNDPGDDGWIVEAGRLEPEVRTELLARTCKALERGDSSDIAYARAARLCPLDTEGVIAQALTRVSRFGKTDGTHEQGFRGDAAWLWSTAIAIRHRPKEAGKLLCEHVSAPGFSEFGEFATLVALRASGVKCDGARGVYAKLRCDEADGGCASDQETRKSWGSELDQPPPRPHAIALRTDGSQLYCNLKRDHDAGSCSAGN